MLFPVPVRPEMDNSTGFVLSVPGSEGTSIKV